MQKYTNLYRNLISLKPEDQTERQFCLEHGIDTSRLSGWKFGGISQKHLEYLSGEFGRPINWFLEDPDERGACDLPVIPPCTDFLRWYGNLLRFIVTAGLHDSEEFAPFLKATKGDVDRLALLYEEARQSPGGIIVEKYYELYFRVQQEMKDIQERYLRAKADIDLYDSRVIAIASVELPVRGGGHMLVPIRDLFEGGISPDGFCIEYETDRQRMVLICEALGGEEKLEDGVPYAMRLPEKCGHQVVRLNRNEGRYHIVDYWNDCPYGTMADPAPFVIGRVGSIKTLPKKNGHLPDMS